MEGDEARELAGARSCASLGNVDYILRALGGSWRNLSRDQIYDLELIHYVALSGMD